MTRKGKIARLPRDVRNELNRRLDNGEQGTHLVAWLNGLPEVKRVLAECFDGREINEQNLSEWKAGGFQDWVALEEVLAQASHMAEKTQGLVEVADGIGTDHLASVLNLRAAAVLAEWTGEVTEEFERKLKALRRLALVVMGLRRSQLQVQHWELEEAKYEDQLEKETRELERKMSEPSFTDFMRSRMAERSRAAAAGGKKDGKKPAAHAAPNEKKAKGRKEEKAKAGKKPSGGPPPATNVQHPVGAEEGGNETHALHNESVNVESPEVEEKKKVRVDATEWPRWGSREWRRRQDG